MKDLVDKIASSRSTFHPLKVLCVFIDSNDGRCQTQDTIYYKWASVKMTLKFHFLWSTLFWLEESVSAVYSDWLRGTEELSVRSWSVTLQNYKIHSAYRSEKAIFNFGIIIALFQQTLNGDHSFFKEIILFINKMANYI